MSDIVSGLNGAFTLAFVVTSMFGLGLGLTARDLLAPLRRVRLVLSALLISFVLLPSVALLLGHLLSLGTNLRIGLILMSAVAGAPLTLQASRLARGDAVAAGSLVTILVIATVMYLPFALPLLIPGAHVDTMSIALPLSLEVLLPLGAGLLVNARYAEEAGMTRRIMTEISNVSLAMMLVLNLGNFPEVLGLVGTGAIAGILIIIFTGLAAGYLLGGPGSSTRRTLAIVSAQRNYAAAFTVAQGSFADRPDVFVTLLSASLLSMVIVLVTAGEFGRRSRNPATVVAGASPSQ
ncbi:MAG: bile acid:sodium symporter family protein [Gemmatimonadaceae bacterium]